MKKLFLLFGLLIFIQPFLSAQTLNITFSVNQEKVLTYKNQIFELIYTVKNDGITY